MFQILYYLLKAILYAFQSKKELIIKNLLQEKEIEILKRKYQKQVKTKRTDRFLFVLLEQFLNIKNIINIVQPETLLTWRDDIIKKNWTYNSKKSVGRPPIPKATKELILDMKNRNILWGSKRIKGELLKLGIILDKKSVWNILRVYRKQGKIKQSLTWKTFLRAQIKSIYAMDFFTVDTISGIRFYVYFIIHHESRKSNNLR